MYREAKLYSLCRKNLGLQHNFASLYMRLSFHMLFAGLTQVLRGFTRLILEFVYGNFTGLPDFFFLF